MTDMDIARKRIQEMFGSKDESLWKIGRLLCHELRIDYWIETSLSFVQLLNTGPHKRVYRVVKYSIEEIRKENIGFNRVYKIKLEKWKNY